MKHLLIKLGDQSQLFLCRNSLGKYMTHTNALHQSTLPQKSSLLYLLARGCSHRDEGMRRWRLASGEGKLPLTLFCS